MICSSECQLLGGGRRGRGLLLSGGFSEVSWKGGSSVVDHMLST